MSNAQKTLVKSLWFHFVQYKFQIIYVLWLTAGEITTSSQINYETLPATTFTLDVTVADPVTFDRETLIINVADVNEAPSFLQSSYSLSANEGSVS